MIHLLITHVQLLQLTLDILSPCCNLEAYLTEFFPYRADPIFLEFPQLIGHSRRDYWFAIIREVLHVHRFIRKYNLCKIQRAEALSKAALGIFRYRALKEAFHVTPSHVKTILAFNLAEKLPKGDKILEALYRRLELLCTKSKCDDALTPSGKKMSDSFPVSFYALARMGFVSMEREDWSEETELLAADAHVGETSALQKAVKESLGYSGKVEAARATLDQVKVEDIETNLVLIKVYFCQNFMFFLFQQQCEELEMWKLYMITFLWG